MHWDFVGNICSIPLDRVACLYSRLNIEYISLIWACTMYIVVSSFLFVFMRVVTCALALALTLRGCDLGYFRPYDQFLLLISKSLCAWFNKDWHIEICDSSWLDWFFGLSIHLSFASGTSTPRLLLTLLWCMVHCGHYMSKPLVLNQGNNHYLLVHVFFMLGLT
jgi:hypothetical protein